MSIYDIKPNGRGRIPRNSLVGELKVSPNVLKEWLCYAKRDWERDGCPTEEDDPGHPYHSLSMYKSLVCARTVSELKRLIQAAVDNGLYSNHVPGYTATKGSHSCWNRRAGRAITKYGKKLYHILQRIEALQAEHGKTPLGVSIGYDHKADEVEAVLASLNAFE